MQKEKEEGRKEEGKEERKKAYHIPLGGFGKIILISWKNSFCSLPLFITVQKQTLRKENVASICLGSSLQLLIHIFPKNLSP